MCYFARWLFAFTSKWIYCICFRLHDFRLLDFRSLSIVYSAEAFDLSPSINPSKCQIENQTTILFISIRFVWAFSSPSTAPIAYWSKCTIILSSPYYICIRIDSNSLLINTVIFSHKMPYWFVFSSKPVALDFSISKIELVFRCVFFYSKIFLFYFRFIRLDIFTYC